MEDNKSNEKPIETNQEGNSSSVSELASLVERMEKANKEKEALIKKEEELIAKKLLGGKSDVGVQPVEKKEETPSEYAKRVLEGKI